MGLTKRMKRLAAEEFEARKIFDPPYTPPPPWTPEELAKIDAMDKMLDKLCYNQWHDIDLVFEFLGHTYLFGQASQRVPDLRSKAIHYRKLISPSAKDNLWNKIHGVLYGLKTEVQLLRNSRDRRGTSIQ
jgi:hypothetical protein